MHVCVCVRPRFNLSLFSEGLPNFVIHVEGQQNHPVLPLLLRRTDH